MDTFYLYFTHISNDVKLLWTKPQEARSDCLAVFESMRTWVILRFPRRAHHHCWHLCARRWALRVENHTASVLLTSYHAGAARPLHGGDGILRDAERIIISMGLGAIVKDAIL